MKSLPAIVFNSIPLRTGYFKNNNHFPVYIHGVNFQKQVEAGMLTFEIPNKIYEDYKNIRLRGIKLSVRWDKSPQTSDRWNFQVNLPKQKDSNGNIIWNIPEFNSVGLMANNPGYIYSGSRDLSIYNASIDGEWMIKLPKKSSRSLLIKSPDMQDILLEILVSARVV